MTPIVKLLRLADGDKPAMGKVYDRMFMIGQKLEESDNIMNLRWLLVDKNAHLGVP